ncbi:hypothetical protein OFM52_29650, partial [Escherichia coli]|nr:hypothetical protein [Escherichia coli]
VKVEIIEVRVIKVEEDFLNVYLSREVLLIFYIIASNRKTLDIKDILINLGINRNIFVSKIFAD